MGTILTSIAVLLRIISNPFGNVFQKQLTIRGVHPLIINFLTYFFLAILCICLVVAIKRPVLPTEFWVYSVLAGIAGALGNSFLVKALHKGDLSILGPINSYKSVVGIIGGIFLLGEFPNFWGLLGVAIIIFGSYFVLETTEDRFTWSLLKRSAIQYRIWAMILNAVEAVFIKKILLVSSTTIAFISWCWFGMIFSFLFLYVYRVNITVEVKNVRIEDLNKYFYLVICIAVMQLTTNYVFKHMPVGYALSLFQLSIIISVILGYKYFKEVDIFKKLIGSAIMIAGSVIIILLKNQF